MYGTATTRNYYITETLTSTEPLTGNGSNYTGSVTLLFSNNNTAISDYGETIPRPRNRRERRIEESIGDGVIEAWAKLNDTFVRFGLQKASQGDKLNHEFWQWISFNVPAIPKLKLQKLDMPIVHPDGRSKRLRLCGARWYPVRS